MRKELLYQVAVVDRLTRKVLVWRISSTPGTDFCLDALSEAIHTFGPPEILNTN